MTDRTETTTAAVQVRCNYWFADAARAPCNYPECECAPAIVDMTETTVSDPPPVHPFAGYQVMVNGREAEIIHLDRDELIRQLAFCIDRFETMDLLYEQLANEVRAFRKGEVPT